MYFTKTPHPANFVFADSFDAKTGKLKIDGIEHEAKIAAYEGGIYHITVEAKPSWESDLNLVALEVPKTATSLGRLSVSNKFEIAIKNSKGQVILQSAAGMGFGKMGVASLFCFESGTSSRYFGLGEKTFGRLELSGLRTKFWNTDAWADFHFGQWDQHPSDPYYLSIPYVIVESKGEYIGLLYHNPFAPFIETAAGTTIPTEYVEPKHLLIGATDGLPSLWIVTGPTLAEVTRKLQKLVGVTPLPPLWALGYHQSRWGYAGEKDLTRLDKKFTEEKIPCDAIWLDIDYMNGFRIFTYSQRAFPKGVPSAVKKISKSGRRVVPIIDPGVKQEVGYDVYDCGKQQDIFCKNPQGHDFVGMVWPGRTVFPDFSLPEARAWWSDYAESFREIGFSGAWLDMNDPSTGAVDPQDMLFRRGKLPHAAFHNQYALGMQMATRDGFLRAEPDRRPFLLTRSGWVGTNRFSAVWTGDNVANRFYLKGCIPTALNLSLSGIPFCGPDVGGFAGDTPEDLMADWVKCCFLFPFMRNHSMLGTREQEPWNYTKKTVDVLRHYIQLRYKLLPYLYQLFINQELNGDPIIRPLIYHYEDPLSSSDQFLIGESILQAPFVDEAETRDMILPGDASWFDVNSGNWKKPSKMTLHRERLSTPMYIRDGSIIPVQPGIRDSAKNDLSVVEFHLFLKGSGTASLDYCFDDGETFAYRRGIRSQEKIEVVAKGSTLDIRTEAVSESAGKLTSQLVLYRQFSKIMVNGVLCKPRKVKVRWCGARIEAWIVRLD